MSWTDTEAFLAALQNTGISLAAGTVAVTREDKGLLQPSDWLEFGHVDGAAIARLVGSTSASFAKPPGWVAGHRHVLTSEAELENSWDLVADDGRVATYRHPVSGECVYVGRTTAPIKHRPWWRFWGDA